MPMKRAKHAAVCLALAGLAAMDVVSPGVSAFQIFSGGLASRASLFSSGLSSSTATHDHCSVTHGALQRGMRV